MADNKFQTPEALARCLPMSRLQAVSYTHLTLPTKA